MEPQASAFTKPVLSPPTAWQGSKQSDGCFESPATETRTSVQAPQEPLDHPKQLGNPVHTSEVQMPEVQELVQSELVQDPEVQEGMQSELVQDPKLQEGMQSELVQDPKLQEGMQSELVQDPEVEEGMQSELVQDPELQEGMQSELVQDPEVEEGMQSELVQDPELQEGMQSELVQDPEVEEGMQSELVQDPEVEEGMQSELVQDPEVQELMFSVSEADALMDLPSYVSDALYVADLHPLAIDNVDLLQELFSQVGNVSIVRVIPNPAGRPPLCSAYVNFHTVEDACRAWQTLNYHVWMGLPMRIMFSNLDPATRYNEDANIIVTDLEESIDSKFLHQLFCKLGVVLSSKVEQDPSGKSTGRGFIQFQDEKDAKRAIELMNNEELKGKKVYVGPFIRRKYHSEADLMNKNPIDLNPAYNPHFDGDVLKEVLKNEAQTIAKSGSLDILFGSSSNFASGSHGIRFGSFEPVLGSHSIQFGSFEPVLISHELAAGYEALQISRSGGITSNNNTKRSHSGGETRKGRKTFLRRASSAERNKARRLAITEKAAKDTRKGKSASSHDSETAVDPPNVPSSEPWPPQPWSVETLKAMYAKACCTEERLAMLGGTLFPLVSNQTKYFVSDVTNELVKLGLKEIEKIMKLSEEDFYQKVSEVKHVVFERIRNLAPFVPTTYHLPDCTEEVKHVIFEEIMNQLPFVPTTVPSLPPAAHDHAKCVNVFEVPDFPVPIVPEFLEFLQAPAAPAMESGIPFIPYPLLPLPVVQPYFPYSVPILNYLRRPGTGFFEPHLEFLLQAELYNIDEALGEGKEDDFTFDTLEDSDQEEEVTAVGESSQPVEVSAHEEHAVVLDAREEQAQPVEVSAREEQAQPVEVFACEEHAQPVEVSAGEEQARPVEVSAREEQVQPVEVSACEEQAEPGEEPVHDGAPQE